MSDQNATPKRCAHRHSDGNSCGRWPSSGSRFCYLHRQAHGDPALSGHPLMRLSSPADLFDVIREALHAARMGRIQPGQAYAVGYLAHLWLRTYRELSCADREAALQGSGLHGVVEHDADSVAATAATPVQPLPPTPDSAIIEGLEEQKSDPALEFPFSLFGPARPNAKGLARRLTAEVLKEMSKPAPANGGAK